MRVFFIVGVPRSGTTLLQRMLDAHPEVGVTPETHFVGRYWLRRQEYGDLSKDENYDRLIQALIATPEFSEMGIQPESFAEAALEIPRGYGPVLQLLLGTYARERGVRLVGEKTPNHLLYMPILLDFIPEALFVHIVRDPRGVANSARHTPWSSGSLYREALAWRRQMQTVRRQKPPPAAIHTLSFEKLVISPERTLRDVCGFLGIIYDEVMLSYHEAEPIGIDVEREPWKAAAIGPLDDSATHRWEAELTTRELAEIEGVVWREMVRMGYNPKTRLPSLLRWAAVSAARDCRRQVKSWVRGLRS